MIREYRYHRISNHTTHLIQTLIHHPRETIKLRKTTKHNITNKSHEVIPFQGSNGQTGKHDKHKT